MKVLIKWLLFAVVNILLLLTTPIAVILISLFTREQPHGKPSYSWGWIWGTYDNPPQGDEGFVKKRALFLNTTTGFKGYLNRVWWMLRNPLYGLSKYFSIKWTENTSVVFKGKRGISDKYGIPGWYLAKAYQGNNLVAFEFYGVFPYTSKRDFRIRVGWKIVTSKFQEIGFAHATVSINPFDGYGNEK